MTIPLVRKKRASKPEKKIPTNRFVHFPWKRLLVAAVPTALAACYMAEVAPGLVPLPAGTNPPFPVLTSFLEKACGWCGENRGWVYGIGAALLAAGCAFRIAIGRYYAFLAIAMTLALALLWYSISAPIERLIRSVEDEIPKDRRVPTAGER